MAHLTQRDNIPQLKGKQFTMGYSVLMGWACGLVLETRDQHLTIKTHLSLSCPALPSPPLPCALLGNHSISISENMFC